MYWKVSKLDPDYLVKRYSVHALLAVSILANALLWFSRPDPTKYRLKTTYEQFARQFTGHYLDYSYPTFLDSQTALVHEVDSRIIPAMRERGWMLKSNDIQTTAQALRMKKTVSSYKITSIDVGEEPSNKGHSALFQKKGEPPPLIPAEISGTVVIHSDDQSASRPFHIKLGMGENSKGAKMVADFADISPAQ